MRFGNTISMLIALLYAGAASGAGIELLSGQDVSIETGGMVGTVSSSEVKKGAPVPFGGAIMGVIFNKDFSNAYTGFIEPQIAIDGATQSVLKKGVNVGMAWHLLGGARRLTDKVAVAHFEESNASNLSVIARTGYFSFSAQPSTVGAKALLGAVIENCIGFEYRYDVFNSSALGFRLMKSLITFPTSVENLRTDYLEVALFWRKLL